MPVVLEPPRRKQPRHRREGEEGDDDEVGYGSDEEDRGPCLHRERPRRHLAGVPGAAPPPPPGRLRRVQREPVDGVGIIVFDLLGPPAGLFKKLAAEDVPRYPHEHKPGNDADALDEGLVPRGLGSHAQERRHDVLRRLVVDILGLDTLEVLLRNLGLERREKPQELVSVLLGRLDSRGVMPFVEGVDHHDRLHGRHLVSSSLGSSRVAAEGASGREGTHGAQQLRLAYREPEHLLPLGDKLRSSRPVDCHSVISTKLAIIESWQNRRNHLDALGPGGCGHLMKELRRVVRKRLLHLLWLPRVERVEPGDGGDVDGSHASPVHLVRRRRPPHRVCHDIRVHPEGVFDALESELEAVPVVDVVPQRVEEQHRAPSDLEVGGVEPVG
mmetsp:Transcript_13483/g.32752  ORF Transcript_13483/g.32752 Transcript_13483/m.32752 type:complete len:385 (+) Transcript_13483:684-1838(+)